MIKKTLSKIRPVVKSAKGKREPAKPVAKPKAQPARATAVKHAPVKTKVELRKPDLKKPLLKNFKPEPKPVPKPIPKILAKDAPKFAPRPPEQKPAKAEAGKATAPKLVISLDPKAKAGLKLDPKALAKKNGAATQEGAPPGTPTKDDPDAPLLDMSDAAVRKMVTRAKQRGYVTYDELNRVLPSDKVSSEQIEDTMAMLNEMGINVIESEEQEEAEGEQVPAVAAGRQVAEVPEKAEETYDRTDDPVRMYLREMGSVELLSREGEIAIAKRIEAGRELMIGALCEGPLTFEALTVWRDELMEGKALLRDIIDLEAMYGGIPGAEGAPGQPIVPSALPGMPGGPPAPGPIGAPPGVAPGPRLRQPRRSNLRPRPRPSKRRAKPLKAAKAKPERAAKAPFRVMRISTTKAISRFRPWKPR